MNKLVSILLTIYFSFFYSQIVQACSACKVTINGRTYFGNNEDNWRLGSKFWFEQIPNKNGVVYFGYRDNFPQGGMNTQGLAFDALTIHFKKAENNALKKDVSNVSHFIKTIMQTATTVEDVKVYAEQFNRKGFERGVFIFADRAGKYLILEPDTILIGSDTHYIIANYCPSTTTETDRLMFERYKKGQIFLKNNYNNHDTSLCLRLIDTMHVCRPKIGDGTLHSYISDLTNLTIDLYFYHDYSQKYRIDLTKELSKGNHELDIATLFKDNAEYKNLLTYKTPFNNWLMQGILYLLFIAFILLTFSYIKTWLKYKLVGDILFIVFNISMLLYIPVLLTTQSVFYYKAPYVDSSKFVSLMSYVPFYLTTGILPIGISLLKNRIQDNALFNWLNIANLVCYIIAVCLFLYWGLI